MRDGLAGEILEFWFGEGGSPESEAGIAQRVGGLWFAASSEVDEEIRRRFLRDLEALGADDLRRLSDARQRLAAVVLLDQFPRNIFRDSPRAFAWDHLALGLTKEMIQAGEDLHLKPAERAFVYMALEHSEDARDQALSVRKFQELCEEVEEGLKPVFEGFLDFAERHKVIIDRFGRFPHRNELLGRASTPEEVKFLKEPGSSF